MQSITSMDRMEIKEFLLFASDGTPHVINKKQKNFAHKKIREEETNKKDAPTIFASPSLRRSRLALLLLLLAGSRMPARD